ncbi:probable transmembrane protein 189 [Coccomyxa sp. Obi]|nr:probable transmembrane protein 189 [Coccomyxa sp. Obi]
MTAVEIPSLLGDKDFNTVGCTQYRLMQSYSLPGFVFRVWILESSSGCDQPEASSSGSSETRTSKRSIDEGEVLHSTFEHQAIVYGTSALLSALLIKGFSDVHDLPGTIGAAIAAVLAYYISDFLTGIYHWGVDNYGDGETPIVGSQIAAFQGHHQKPWTITEREFCNNVHKVFKPALPFSLLCLLASPWLPAPVEVFLSTATFLTCMSQQFHAWSHMKKSELHPIVDALQGAGILVSRKAHGAHHRAPFEGNYCIVSGFWNPILDAGGSPDGFFRRLERFVAARTGVEPRCWYEPDYSWQETPDAPLQGKVSS